MVSVSSSKEWRQGFKTHRNKRPNLFEAVGVEVLESENVEDADGALVLAADLVVVLPVDGHVDLLDDVNEQAAVDALRERVAHVATLVRVQGGNLEGFQGFSVPYLGPML